MSISIITMEFWQILSFVVLAIPYGSSVETETIKGTIYSDNEFIFYVNGKEIARDDFPTILGHNAMNVSFSVENGKDLVLAIEAIDWASNDTGLEFDNRCIGSGGLRAMFSNGVVTNSSWVCKTHTYGPLNWKKCFGAQTVRNQSLQLHLACLQPDTPPLVGCTTRTTPKPEGWTSLNFDDSHWEYALEYDARDVGYGKPPTGCSEPRAYISSDVDSNGVNATCPQNLDWGKANFIWRPDRDLDNTILCRYVLRLEDSTLSFSLSYITILVGLIASFVHNLK